MNLSLSRTEDPRCTKALEFLNVQIRSGVKLGLDSTLALLDRLGNPQNDLRFIHVAGTNGKGSVCALLAGALTACGFKTGFFSSPHLVNFRERYRINLEAIPEADLADLIEELQDKAGDMFNKPDSPSFFEVSTVLGLMYFSKKKCDIAVLEVGMGGRLDATNVVDPVLSIITRVDFDHMKPLGNTLTEIAGEKAGIIKASRPVLAGAQPDEAMAVIKAVAEKNNAPITLPDEDYQAIAFNAGAKPFTQVNDLLFGTERTSLTTRFLGPHQLENTATAWAALNVLRSLGYNLDLELARKGMGEVRWPARMDLRSDGTLIDAAHNVSGAGVLTSSLDTYFPGKTWNVLFGALSSKNWREMLRLLRPYCRSITLTQFEHNKVATTGELGDYVRDTFPDLDCCEVPNTIEALDHVLAKGDALIVGSLYMAGTVLATYTNGMPVLIHHDAAPSN